MIARLVSVLPRLRAGRTGVQIPAGIRDICHLQIVQTGSGAHPTPIKWVPVFFCQGYSGRSVMLQLTAIFAPSVCLHRVDKGNFIILIARFNIIKPLHLASYPQRYI